MATPRAATRPPACATRGERPDGRSPHAARPARCACHRSLAPTNAEGNGKNPRSARTRHRFRDRGRCGQAVILVQASKHGACCRLLHPQPEEGQLTMDLSGTWRLESAYFVAQKTGDRVDLLGAEPFGFLTLEPSGRSALARRRPAIPRHSSTRRFPRPLLVDGETAVAQVDGAWDPSWVGPSKYGSSQSADGNHRSGRHLFNTRHSLTTRLSPIRPGTGKRRGRQGPRSMGGCRRTSDERAPRRFLS